jgi:hypothetical protein
MKSPGVMAYRKKIIIEAANKIITIYVSLFVKNELMTDSFQFKVRLLITFPLFGRPLDPNLMFFTRGPQMWLI